MAKSNWIGKSLSGRYKIEEMLGQGGMSAVYKANDPNLKRVVAVKMIHPHLSSDPDFVKRFEEEATAVAQLRHPSIIQVYDFNSDDDNYYMVLEFVPGETVQDHLKRLNASGRKLSVTKAIEYIADICDAVDYAHQRGMIHRDIKPANIMLNVMGQAILMDFGIAKIVGGQRHTATGAVVGTAMYMAPEQITGESPDRRADIYSLGVTLFEMLSGQPPFEADSAMTLMMMHVNDPVPDVRELNPDVPDDLVAVINKSLSKKPDDRYQSAAQMAAALRNVLGRIKTGASAEAPAPVGATTVERPDMTPAGPGATVVETADMPPANLPGGTYVEPVSTPAGGLQGTQVEPSTPPPPAATSLGGSGGSGAAVGATGTGAMPAPKAPSTGALPRKFGLSLPLIAVGVIAVVCMLGVGIFGASRLFAGGLGASPATEEPVVPIVNTTAPTETSAPEPTATAPEPTVTPTETPIPATPTPEGPYVVITGISIDSSNYYVVAYEVHNFPDSPQLHVHMFFDTVPPEQAGSPGSGPWKLTWGAYGDPPFRQYTVSNRPSGANQMCALVANPNHSIQLNSGNCMALPEN
ncbi:MAG: protein kinase [Anaerolineales bacterium]|nr:protein kinase [Anaerolineales bacterium]